MYHMQFVYWVFLINVLCIRSLRDIVEACTRDLKDKCFYNYNEQRHKGKNKRITINHKWEFLKAESDKNIHSQKGIENRMIRSIQSEGAFGNTKENYDFT